MAFSSQCQAEYCIKDSLPVIPPFRHDAENSCEGDNVPLTGIEGMGSYCKPFLKGFAQRNHAGYIRASEK
jgi:hypothetical protein